MCGVAAIYAYNPEAPFACRNELRRIRDYMTKRGPDGFGEWFSSDSRIALGHRRLAIIDLTDRASQPMSSHDGKLTISFNGEIYNYKTLRRQLEQKGCVFKSESDTEVLLHLYADKGKEMVHDLRGMFAFVIWDSVKSRMFMARDPYGIKPLYYSNDGQTIRVASQVKALLAGLKVSKQVEPAGMVGFFLFGSVPEPYTTYKDIHAVPAGCYVWVDNKGVHSPEAYYSIADVYNKAVERHLFERHLFERHHIGQKEVKDALLDSVRHHLVADVPVGAFLSAGVDSGALVALMKDAGQVDVQTVTLAFEEYKGLSENEAPLAECVAKHYNCRHTTRYITREEFIQDIPRILEAMDQPSIDGINTWFVAKATHELGLKVAVSGLGGDELFGGYPSFKDIPTWTRLLSIPAQIPGFGELFRKGLSALEKLNISFRPKLAGLIKYGGSYPGAYLLRRGLFMPWELPKLLNEDMVREGLQRLDPLEYIGNALDPDPGQSFARIATMESSLYMRNQLLPDTDWASMDHSLEVRTPLVDSLLLKNLAPILVGKEKLASKSFLAKSPNKELPNSIVNRAKTGFSIPMSNWITSSSEFDSWKKVPMLNNKYCHWSRRWAYTIASTIN
jgi:asparagine synthase (glutamine-hydrolysing)